jgi:hypothetical protein
MRKFRSEIAIDATPERVWEVLSDFGSYRIWNPFITKAEGSASLHGHLRLTVTLAGLPAVGFSAMLTGFEPPRRLGWHAFLVPGGMFEALHRFELHPLDSGRTLFVHLEEFGGWLSAPALLLLGGAFRKGYAGMNRALKQRAES